MKVGITILIHSISNQISVLITYLTQNNVAPELRNFYTNASSSILDLGS